MSAATSDSTEQLNICRRTKRGNERCEKVRVVAADLFLAHGYDGVSLDDIIAQSGGSKTNIYSHFGGKEGLFIGIIEGLCDEVHAALAAVRSQRLGCRGRVAPSGTGSAKGRA